MRSVSFDCGRKNPLNADVVRKLSDAVAPDPEAPVVVLRGRSDTFCAGLDNRILATGAFEREDLLAAMGELLLAMIEGPTRIVCAVEGDAVAAGAMLLLASDIRIGSRGDYKIGFTELRLGMPLPEIPLILARQRLDRRHLHELTALGRILDPAEARECGFLDEIVDPQALDIRAQEKAQELARLDTGAYTATRASLWNGDLARMQLLVEEQLARCEVLSG